jgi:lysophospholipase L1-like esterase
MRRRSFSVVSATTITLLALGVVPSARAASPPLPNSMAAIGDSISQAADVCCWYGDHPGKSWSTGDDQGDSILSHYERILAANPNIAGNEHNDSVSGAKMADAEGQAARAVSQQVKYVTILMGANDACTSSIDTMTPVANFKTQFQTAMATLESGLPASAHIFVSSIPNIYRLWKILHTNPLAQAVWYAAKICQSMLSPFNTRRDRLTVLAREKAYNHVLAHVCGQYANCLCDGYGVFNYMFTTSQVSKLDYFHPNISGQSAVAAVTWATSWWPGI